MSIIVLKPFVSVDEAGSFPQEVGIMLSGDFGNVTVASPSVSQQFTCSPTSLNFTSANWNVPQKITITGADTGATNLIRRVTWTLTATGGLSSVKNVDIAVYETGLGVFFDYRKWMHEVKINVLADVTTYRNLLIAGVFNGNGLPSNAVPVSTTTSYTGNMHTISTGELTGAGSITRYLFQVTDSQGRLWDFFFYRIPTTHGTPKNQILFDLEGHENPGVTETGHATLINALLAQGYDFMYCSLPQAGENTEDNPNVDSSASSITTRHNQILLARVDKTGACGLELFDSAIIQAINFIQANFSYTDINIDGISGGANVALRIAAMDVRVKRCMVTRGLTTSAFRTIGGTEADFEEGTTDTTWYTGGRRIYDLLMAVPTFTRMLLACSNGRRVGVLNNTQDATGGGTNNVWAPKMAELAAIVNGTITSYLDTGGAGSSHAFSAFDTNAILTELAL